MKPETDRRRDRILTLLLSLLTLGMFLLPTGFETSARGISQARALVLATDNSETEQYGIVRTGNQEVRLRILSGPFRGTVTESTNILMGKLELDKMFAPGDTALVNISTDGEGNLAYAKVVDHYRIRTELLLLGLFILLLLVYAGWTGLKAVVSFLFTGAVIWKLLLPGLLKGLNPVLISLGLVSLMTGGIIFLIGGLTR